MGTVVVLVHNTAQNGSDNLPSYPSDCHPCYWTGGKWRSW